MDKQHLLLKKIFCEAIRKCRLVQFMYQSDGDKYPTLRKVEPYLVVVTEKGEGKMKLVGYPVNRLPQNKQLGHYLFEKLNIDDIVVLHETFDRLRVDDKIVYDTPSVLVLCRVRFD